MISIDLLSFIYGICLGVIPTVIIMSIAAFVDDKLNKENDHE